MLALPAIEICASSNTVSAIAVSDNLVMLFEATLTCGWSVNATRVNAHGRHRGVMRRRRSVGHRCC